MKGNHTSLREVQDKLLSFINADTILIGHGLETNLCALKVTKLFLVWYDHLKPLLAQELQLTEETFSTSSSNMANIVSIEIKLYIHINF